MNSEILVKFKGDTKDLEDANNKAEKSTFSLKDALEPGLKTAAGVAAGAIAAASAAVAGLTKTTWDSAKQVAAYGDEVDKNSQKVGFSTDAYQEWDYVMQIAGTSMADCTVGMKTLAKQADDAAKGGKNSSEAFKQLGIDTSNLANMSREDIFGAVISGLNKMPDSAERAALASELLGKSGQNLTPLFNMMDEDIEALRDDAHLYGMVMEEDGVKSSANFQDAMTKLTKTTGGLKNKMVGALLPGINDLIDGFTEVAIGSDQANYYFNSGIEKIINTVSEMLPKIMETLTKMLPTIIQAGAKIIISLIQGIAQAIPQIAPTIVKLMLQINQTLISMLPQLLKIGLQIIQELALGIAQALPTMIPDIINIIIEMVETLIDNVDLLIDASIQLIIGLTEGIINALPILIQRAPEIVIKLVKAIIKAAPKLLEGAAALIGKIVEGLLNGLGKIAEVGWKLIEGLINGIKEGWNRLKEGAKEVGNSVVNFFKGIFGIHSPSRVFKQQIGVNIGLGIVEGLEDTEKQIQKQISGMGTNMTTGLKLSTGNMNNTLSPQLIGNANTHLSPQINIVVNNDIKQDPLGQMVSNIKTFSGGSKNDYNYGMGN